MPIKLLVVDDHLIAVDGARALVANTEITVAGVASTTKEALEQVCSNAFDVVLLDVRLRDRSGFDVLEKMAAEGCKTPVLMFSGYDNPTYIARSAALGAHNYLLKSSSRAEFLAAIQCAAEGRAAPNSSLLNRQVAEMASDLDQSKLPAGISLTNRETQVLRRISLGLSNKEIASSLAISVDTVKEHVQNLLRKLQATDRTDAAVKVIRMGVVN